MLTINAVEMPPPSTLEVRIIDLSKAERNANGVLIIERIRGGVRKLELSWVLLSQSELSALFVAVSPVTFVVVYPDPQTGAARTMTAYSGDRSVGMIAYNDGVPTYKDTKFNLIEC
jgi:hypothetical protein